MDKIKLVITPDEAKSVLGALKEVRGPIQVVGFWRSIADSVLPAAKQGTNVEVEMTARDLVSLASLISGFKGYTIDDAAVVPGLLKKMTDLAGEAAKKEEEANDLKAKAKEEDGQTEETTKPQSGVGKKL